MIRFLQLCGILMLAFILFAISSATNPRMVQPPERTPVEDAAPTPLPITDPDEPGYAIIEFGISELIRHNNDPIHAYIRFPQSGNPTLDNPISGWAHGIYNDMASEFLAIQEHEPRALGEVNVHFNSFVIDNRYAGILETGKISYSMTSEPIPGQEIVKSFNIDLQRDRFLESGDILDFSKTEDIISPLLVTRMRVEHPSTEGHLNFVDESWLGNLVIGHRGIIVVLEKGKQLPDTFPTLTVTLPYDELGSALLIRRDPPLETAPTPEITPQPLPDFDNITIVDDDGVEITYELPRQSNTIDPSKPMIALSFSDGPGLYTDLFLDLLEKHNVRATFCVVGNIANTNPDSLQRAVDLGSEVIGQSWDHRNLAKLSAEDVRPQILETSEVIFDITETELLMFRPPYGAVSDTLREVAAELGYVIVYWSVDPEDWNTDNPDDVYYSVLQRVKDGSIVLSHEIYRSTLLAYQHLIPELIEQGFQLVTVSELLYHKYGELTPGNVYYSGHDIN